MTKTREDNIMESYYKGEISRAYMLCLISDDCSKCPRCYIDDEKDPVYFRGTIKNPIVEDGVRVD